MMVLAGLKFIFSCEAVWEQKLKQQKELFQKKTFGKF